MQSKSYSIRKEGDKIHISIIDENNITLFKGHASIRDKKGIRKLMKDVEFKGVNLKSEIDWLD